MRSPSIWPWSAWSREYVVLLQKAESDSPRLHIQEPARYRVRWKYLVLALCSGLATFLGGFATAQWLQNEEAEPYGNKKINFRYNSTFSIAPSNASNRAWDSLTPPGRGFVAGSAIDKSAVYGLTVFHQLHCLDMIRHGFYAAAEPGAQLDEAEDHGNEETPRMHARHCFDYLRQTIQCAADMNLEPVDVSLGGVKGWTQHVCHDFEAVQKMAAERRPEREDEIPEIHRSHNS